jgi:hypothetical protein
MRHPPNLDRLEQILATDYQVGFAHDVVGDDPDNVYDWQDDFYLPLTGFKRIERPGPNLSVYVRRGISSDIRPLGRN